MIRVKSKLPISVFYLEQRCWDQIFFMQINQLTNQTQCQFTKFFLALMFSYQILDLSNENKKNIVTLTCKFQSKIYIVIIFQQAKQQFFMIRENINQSKPQDRQMLGRFQINPLLYLYVPILFVTPLYTYHMAVTHKQQKPWPWSTVTQTACHYPQDIAFRYNMLIAASMIALSFYVVFRWLQNQCLRVGYRTLSKWYFYVTQFSMLLYAITIGTIDQKGTGPLHTPCAVTFFIVWLAVIIKVTVFMSELRKYDTSVVSGKSMLVKKLLAGYVSGVWIYCLVGLILTSEQSQIQGKSDKYVVIVQWNSVLINLLWVLSFVFQWKQLNFCLDFYSKTSDHIQNLTSVQQQTIRTGLKRNSCEIQCVYRQQNKIQQNQFKVNQCQYQPQTAYSGYQENMHESGRVRIN